MSNDIKLKSIAELASYQFRIPFQQRGYKWTPDNIIILIKDLLDFIQSEKILYCLQPITVYQDNEDFVVIDGQQRLTTLFLLQKYLKEEHNADLVSYSLSYDRDKNEERKKLLINPIVAIDDKDSDSFFITRAYLTIKEAFEQKDSPYSPSDFIELLKRESCQKSVQVIWYLLENDRKAHQVFRDLNSGKIQLSNAELIKALLLNRTNHLRNHEQIAAQFETIERELDNDRLWYMFNDKEPNRIKGQSRIDILFNIVAGVTPSEYDIDSRKSFFVFCNSDLNNKWLEVIDLYSRLKDFYNDTYIYHYIGFYNYMKGSQRVFRLKDIVERSKKTGKHAFKESLRKEMISLVALDPNKGFSIDDFSYGVKPQKLRGLFILHNIATILSAYDALNEALKKHNKKEVRTYEYFPFDLLHKQGWDIEHISSQTENSLTSEAERNEWLEGVKTDFDFPQSVEQRIGSSTLDDEKSLDELLRLYRSLNLKDGDSFNAFFKRFVEIFDNNIANKHGLGNLVLLDSHTNRSFHNSLFPRKRRIVIIADGGSQDKVIKEKVERVYIPICTKNVYLKAYNKKRDVSLTNWTQDDYDAYYDDIQQKINDYFVSPKEQQV